MFHGRRLEQPLCPYHNKHITHYFNIISCYLRSASGSNQVTWCSLAGYLKDYLTQFRNQVLGCNYPGTPTRFQIPSDLSKERKYVTKTTAFRVVAWWFHWLRAVSPLFRFLPSLLTSSNKAAKQKYLSHCVMCSTSSHYVHVIYKEISIHSVPTQPLNRLPGVWQLSI